MVCHKLNISRQTVYRWIDEDPIFREMYDTAMQQGNESIADIAESKLMINVNNGHQRAIEFALISNREKYYRPKKPAPHPSTKLSPISSIEFIEHKDNIIENNEDNNSL